MTNSSGAFSQDWDLEFSPKNQFFPLKKILLAAVASVPALR